VTPRDRSASSGVREESFASARSREGSRRDDEAHRNIADESDSDSSSSSSASSASPSSPLLTPRKERHRSRSTKNPAAAAAAAAAGRKSLSPRRRVRDPPSKNVARRRSSPPRRQRPMDDPVGVAVRRSGSHPVKWSEPPLQPSFKMERRRSRPEIAETVVDSGRGSSTSSSRFESPQSSLAPSSGGRDASFWSTGSSGHEEQPPSGAHCSTYTGKESDCRNDRSCVWRKRFNTCEESCHTYDREKCNEHSRKCSSLGGVVCVDACHRFLGDEDGCSRQTHCRWNNSQSNCSDVRSNHPYEMPKNVDRLRNLWEGVGQRRLNIVGHSEDGVIVEPTPNAQRRPRSLRPLLSRSSTSPSSQPQHSPLALIPTA
jgi:hypothetical protein